MHGRILYLMTAVGALTLSACGHSSHHADPPDANAGFDGARVDAPMATDSASDVATDADVQCSAGAFDTTFAAGGFLTIHLGQFSLGSAIKVDSAGRIVVGGSATNTRDGHSACVIGRWLSSGVADASFGTNGIVEVAFSGRDCSLWDISVDLNGGIVGVGGIDGTAADVFLMRVDDNGNLDQTFGASGIVENTPAVFGHAVALSTDAQERLVVALQQWDGIDPGAPSHFRVLRYLADGTLDASFAPNAQTDPAFTSGHDLAFDVDVRPDGKIVAVGKTEPGQRMLFAASRFNDDGSLDSGFGSNGVSTVDFDGAASGVAVDSAEDVVLAGEINAQVGICGGFARLTAAGAPDLGFGNDATTSVCGALHRLTLQRVAISSVDGSILGVGWTSMSNPTGSRLVVTRLNANGVLDASFGSSGLVQWSGSATDASAGDIAIQPDGHIVVTGSIGDDTTFDLLVARFCP